MPPIVARVDLDKLNPHQEIVVRAGTVRPPDPHVDVAQILINNYSALDENYPGVYGLSVLYHQGLDIDVLAQPSSS